MVVQVLASMRMHAAGMVTEGVCVCVSVCVCLCVCPCVSVCVRVCPCVSGTMHGGSAIALASGSKTNSVVTYNIVDDFSPNAAACGMAGLQFTTSPSTLLRLLPLYYYSSLFTASSLFATSPRVLLPVAVLFFTTPASSLLRLLPLYRTSSLVTMYYTSSLFTTPGPFYYVSSLFTTAPSTFLRLFPLYRISSLFTASRSFVPLHPKP